MLRSVPDTNAVISSFLFEYTVPAQALQKLNNETEMLASDETFTEVREVLARPKFDRYISAAAKARLLTRFRNSVTMIPITEHIVACRHPKDDKFLSLAVSGNADLILTGDNDLLVLHPFQGIDIISPTDYLTRPAQPG
jgi:putative PIN family toxin of toxin-antitoxin system